MVDSYSGFQSAVTFDPFVVKIPLVASKSFGAYGIPCNGPRYRPLWISRSASRARSNACSAVTVMNAFSFGFKASIRARYVSTTSTGDTSCVRIKVPNSRAFLKTSSSITAMAQTSLGTKIVAGSTRSSTSSSRTILN